MKADPHAELSGLRLFRVEVVHPKNGAKSSIVIHAGTVDDAVKMVHAAGLLAETITPVLGENANQGSINYARLARMSQRPPAEPATQDQSSLQNFIDRISWVWGILGFCALVGGIIAAIFFDSIEAKMIFFIGLFMQGIFAAYRWYWRDQGPWR